MSQLYNVRELKKFCGEGAANLDNVRVENFFFFWYNGGELRQFFVHITQDRLTETDTGANHYQLATAAADNDTVNVDVVSCLSS